MASHLFLLSLSLSHDNTAALNVSLTTVGCDEYTELCTRFQVTDYPTVLIFTPSTLHSPVPLTGPLDATHLLAALGQPIRESEHISLVRSQICPPLVSEQPLSLPPSQVELTPSSLPYLLRERQKTIVLWCDSDTASEMAKMFLAEQSREAHSDFVFAWINRYTHGQCDYC